MALYQQDDYRKLPPSTISLGTTEQKYFIANNDKNPGNGFLILIVKILSLTA